MLRQAFVGPDSLRRLCNLQICSCKDRFLANFSPKSVGSQKNVSRPHPCICSICSNIYIYILSLDTCQFGHCQDLSTCFNCVTIGDTVVRQWNSEYDRFLGHFSFLSKLLVGSHSIAPSPLRVWHSRWARFEGLDVPYKTVSFRSVTLRRGSRNKNRPGP